MKELLVPVGNMESLKAAVLNGADAVYLGGKKFGARAYSDNFTDEEMVEAIKFCHLYGVKIYVTVNILIYESELESVYNYCKFLHKNGVDALIVQDIGLISLLARRLPNLEIHASTQVHTVNEETLKLLEDLNVKRVVLARELSLSEIDKMKTSMEKEIFIHGALCICYSGECLFSSVLLNRSGNRGMCAQVCRLPYRIKVNGQFAQTDGKYLLSTKELKTVEYFDQIMASSVQSLKIEGRMKSKEYVACVTKLYRNLIDYYYGKSDLKIDEYEHDLEVIFNRKYTKGFLNNATNEEIINIHTSNHLGVNLGKVIDIDKKYIYIKLNEKLNQGDGIRINESNNGMIVNYLYDSQKKLINSSDDIAIIDNKLKCKIGDTVNKTSDIEIMKKYDLLDDRKIGIDIKFETIDTMAYIFITDGINEVKLGREIVSKSINISIDKAIVLDKLSKLGNTPFYIKSYEINLSDSIFINIKDINQLRRDAIDELIDIRSNSKKEFIELDDKANVNENYIDKLILSVLVRTEEQLKKCLNYFDRIYIHDKKVYEKYIDNEKVYYQTSRIFEDVSYNRCLSTELGSVYKNHGVIDYYLNITNHETINYFNKYNNIKTLSVELSEEEIKKIMDYYNHKCNVELLVYSRIEMMITKYCPINYLFNKDKICNKCINNKYELVDRNNVSYPIVNDISKHLTHILDSKVTNNIDRINYYYDLGIRNFRIELLDETIEDINIIIENLDKKRTT